MGSANKLLYESGVNRVTISIYNQDKAYYLKNKTHNHPGNIAYPSGLGSSELSGDLSNAKYFIDDNRSKGRGIPDISIYIGGKRLPYSDKSTIKDFPSAGSPF